VCHGLGPAAGTRRPIAGDDGADGDNARDDRLGDDLDVGHDDLDVGRDDGDAGWRHHLVDHPGHDRDDDLDTGWRHDVVDHPDHDRDDDLDTG
jgi:hypothetical protein